MNPSIRVLFVEHDQDMAATYMESFDSPEFQATTTDNGEKALNLLEKSGEKFDVVVTDNYTSEMDGVTLLRKIRQTFPGMNVIIVTGYGDWEHFLEGQDLGVVRFMNKPIKLNGLKNLIRSLQPSVTTHQ